MARSSLIHLRAHPDAHTISANRTVLLTSEDGWINRRAARQGLFVDETRLLSRHELRIDGQLPRAVALSSVETDSWLGYYIHTPAQSNRQQDRGSGAVNALSEETIEIKVSRRASDGFRESIDITNFCRRPIDITVVLSVDADFADLSETVQKRQQRGEKTREWAADLGRLHFEYRAEHHFDHDPEHGTAHLDRHAFISVSSSTGFPAWRFGAFRWRVRLDPRGEWRASIDVSPHASAADGRIGARRRIKFLARSTRISTIAPASLAPVVEAVVNRSRSDLASLRLHDLDADDDRWTMAAGVPMYVALFGRDTLTTSWQAGLLGPEMMAGTLEALAQRQGKEINDWRDEQPGRMLHEAHTGPLEVLNFNPRGRSYGSITTSGFFPVIVSEFWHWTGDKDRTRAFIGPALDALQWLDRFGDIDGDGFYEYQTRSPQGVKHQAWKDSPDAIVDTSGNPVEPPIATCEEQAFVYVAKLHLSEVLYWLKERDLARQLFHEAGELKARFNDRFWDSTHDFVAMGLDSRKQQIRSIASNAGHCLAAGILDDEHASLVAARLMAPDMFSGWGIRTLSSAHPAYNPHSYHRGSVWPVEQASFVLGFARYGLHAHASTLARAEFEAAALFDSYRLPELFAGHTRDRQHPFPAMYLQANSPQAWSASAPLMIVQSLLGLYPYAPLNVLVVDPQLPDWLPEINLRRLRVGDAVVSLRFFRRPDGSSDYTVLDKRGPLHIVRQPSPWSLTATWGERLKDLIGSAIR